ncbi:MAG: hypothetical protein ACRC7O_07025 [Fimbriiglobus sp.]
MSFFRVYRTVARSTVTPPDQDRQLGDDAVAGASDPTPQPGDGLESYFQRVIKLVPAEVVAIYVPICELIDGRLSTAAAAEPPASDRVAAVLQWAWPVLCMGILVLIRARFTAGPRPDQKTQWGAVVVSTIAFVVWVYQLGGPFRAVGWHDPLIGLILMIVASFILPIFYEGEKN